MSKKRPPFRGRTRKAKQNPMDMLGQVQRMQEEMKATQESLAAETVSVTSGGGAITVVITGQQRVQSIEIAPEVIDPEEREMLQDLLVAAINSAIEQSQAVAAQKMESITGGVGLNDLLGGL